MEVPAPTGAAVRSWVAEAAASVSLSSLAGTATTVVVFVPVLFLPGALGSLYGDLAAALAASVIAGWVYAQFCLPCLFGIFLHRVLAPGRRKTPPSFRKPAGIYGRILKACMGWPLPLALLAGALCVLGTLLTLFRPAAFLDPGSAAELELRLDFETLTTLEAALPRGLGASAILSRIPGIETFYGRMGAEAEDRDRRSRPDYRKECLLFRCFLRKGTDASKAIGEIREALREGGFVQGQGGLSLSISVPEDFTQSLLGLSQGRRLAVRGGSREEVLARTEEAVRVLQERLAESGERPLGEIRVTPTGKRPEIRLIPRREAAAYAGVSVLTLAETVYGSTEGIVTGRIEMNGHPLEIRVKDKGGTDFELLPLASDMASAGGAGTTPPLFLGSLSRREKRETEAVLLREDRSDVIYLDLIPRTGKEKVLFRHISDLLGSEKKALGEKGISGAGESIFVRYKDSLMVTIVTVLVLLYITLGAQFESFRLPFLFLLAIPFSLAGAGPALALTGSGLDSGSVLALIVLFGLAVNNGIVLYESAEEQHGAGLPAREAVFRGSVERLRPVCITTATTVLALLPLCFSPLGGSQVSLARTMTGGIIASTLLSLLVLPPGFVPFLKARERRRIP
jgi:multidrug efflux pump subunit AcrB